MGETARQVQRLAEEVRRARTAQPLTSGEHNQRTIIAQLDLLIELVASQAGYAEEARLRHPPVASVFRRDR